MKVKHVALPDVWRVCNKIRAAIFRIGLNLYDYFKPLDPDNKCLISEKQFISVLGRQIRNHIGLSDQEISELADYFKVQDGRIFYTQLCEIIHKSVPDFSKNPPLVSGLEWEDPLHENPLGPREERHISLLMTKIAALVNTRHLILRPFFQDYEMISKSCGTVTIAHFGRVLYFLGIHVSAEEFNLLVKKYMKDAYTVSYNAFLARLDAITTYWEKHGITDLGGDILPQFPGRIINAELPKLPRPEIGTISIKDIYGVQKNIHPSMEKPIPSDDLVTVMKRIQKYVYTYGIRTTDFFQQFDSMNCGKISCNQFRRGLTDMANGSIYFSEHEIWQMIIYYRDPNDAERVCWRTFTDDIDQVFTTKELEKWPECEVEPYPQDVQEVRRRGQAPWIDVEPRLRDLCEETLNNIKQKTQRRRICLKPIFRYYDKLNNGHISRTQYRQALLSSNILLAEEEMTALEARFCDELGFNYFWFLNEVKPEPLEEPLYTEYSKRIKEVNCGVPKETPTVCERDIVMILGKIKAKAVRDRIDIYQFLRDFDCHRERAISMENFVRGLTTCDIKLTETEFEVLAETFAVPMRPGFVDYVNFVKTIDEAFTQAELERAPLIIPIPHYPSETNPRTFLNFEERHSVAIALEKLAVVGDRNLDEVFGDYDKGRCGLLTKHQFVKGLSVRNMVHLISSLEVDAICKAFSYYKGNENEIDYRAFLRALDILHVNLKKKPT